VRQKVVIPLFVSLWVEKGNPRTLPQMFAQLMVSKPYFCSLYALKPDEIKLVG
jgi:hypothetical protein